MSSRHHFATDPKAVPFAGLFAPIAPLAEAISEVLAGCFAFAGGIARAASHRRRERHTIDVLMALSDHTLRDIGLHRVEIVAVAHHVVHHPGIDYRRHAGRPRG
jgi:uncharacterized protein YjiS (DUF1127 family)